MEHIDVELFGRFAVRRHGQSLPATEAQRVQELLSYLLLHRTRAHHREVLVETLWGEIRPDQGRKNLRQTLWQLQSAIDSDQTSTPLLITDAQWVQLNPNAPITVDTEQVERAFAEVCDQAGGALSRQQSEQVSQAVSLYQGDLLDGWYQDWCIIPRERLRTIYLILLEKLTDYFEASRAFERGIATAHIILSVDRAREQTHRQLMRLYTYTGNRSDALRQFDRCVAALIEEFDVEPDERTILLFNEIRASHVTGLSRARQAASTDAAAISSTSDQLLHAQSILDSARFRLRHDLDAVNHILDSIPANPLPTETAHETAQRRVDGHTGSITPDT